MQEQKKQNVLLMLFKMRYVGDNLAMSFHQTMTWKGMEYHMYNNIKLYSMQQVSTYIKTFSSKKLKNTHYLATFKPQCLKSAWVLRRCQKPENDSHIYINKSELWLADYLSTQIPVLIDTSNTSSRSLGLKTHAGMPHAKTHKPQHFLNSVH